MSPARPAIAGLVLLGFLSAAAPARASVLYRCDAKDGSIAYTGSPKGFSNCKVLQHFADVAPKKEAARAAAPAAAPASVPARNGVETRRWVYEENPTLKADFLNVAAGVGTEPPDIARASFARVRGGVASTARIIVPEDFSTVLADVTSTARMLEPPLFIAAPYRPRPQSAPPPLSTTALATATAAAAAATVSPTKILRGAVYRVQRKDGITEYTNIRPAKGAFAVLFTYIATCVACDIHSKIDFARTALNMEAYKSEIAAAAADFGVDTALLRAVIHAESAFNPMAVSNKGAQGLMQLMPGTAGDLGVTDAFDVAQNIRGGARYLSQLLRDFNGDTQLAAAAYNAGPGAVQKYRGVPPYDETRLYVQRVTTLRERYKAGIRE
jgi:soluble lytic murein transglycosylase-like protein